MARVKRATKKQQQPAQPRWYTHRYTLTTALWLVVAAAGAAGLARLEAHAKTDLSDAPTRLVWQNAPNWLAQDSWSHVLPRIETQIDLDPRTQIYDANVCPWVRAQLEKTPWIREINQISKRHDGAVLVDAEFRTPFAYVRHRDTAYLCDEMGVRLPERAVADQINTREWWIIEGITNPPPPIGRTWSDPGLPDGLRLARFLYDNERDLGDRARRQLVAIDVANFDLARDPFAAKLQIVGVGRTARVYWGVAPGEEFAVETPPLQKIKMLRSVFDRLGQLPHNRFVDLRDEDVPLHGPLGEG